MMRIGYYSFRQNLRRFSNSQVHQKNVEMKIREKLTKELKPLHLEVQNESYMHNVPKDSETHFRVRVVSATFESKALVVRHRMINDVLKEELLTGVHALAIEALSPDQWEASDKKKTHSPPCRGGMGL